MLTEAVTNNIWLFCRRSKHPQIKLSTWAVAFLWSRLGIAFTVLCIDGGSEWWGWHVLHASLLEANVVMEPTGEAHWADNGKAEYSIGIISRQTQLLLFAFGLDVFFWCFVIIYATLPVNLRPKSDGGPSSHQLLHKKVPSYANLFRFGLFVYLVNWRLTRRSPESATVLCRFLGPIGNTNIAMFYNVTTHQVGYARHCVIDELDLNLLPSDRSPAARVLAGIGADQDGHEPLRQAIIELTATLSPWISGSLAQYLIPTLPDDDNLGLITDPEFLLGHLPVTGFVPGSTVERFPAVQRSGLVISPRD
jgi:hypothetical protein